jgi:LPXTG-motif cell wall-anchored protein
VALEHAQLPFTGNSNWPPLLGLLALGFGGALLLISRRRNLRRS